MKNYLIDHIGRNYILFSTTEIFKGTTYQFCASASHVQPLLNLITDEHFMLEVKS